MNWLTNIMDTQGPQLVAMRAEVEERLMDRRIREEQDAAFQVRVLIIDHSAYTCMACCASYMHTLQAYQGGISRRDNEKMRKREKEVCVWICGVTIALI